MFVIKHFLPHFLKEGLLKNTDTCLFPEKFKNVSGFDTSPFGIEWMSFEKDCLIDPLIQTVPHLAFVVPNQDYELANRGLRIISTPSQPSDGLRVAMIEHNGTPIELMEFEKR